MNYRSVVNVIGFLLVFLGLSMIFSIGWSLYFNDDINSSRDLLALIKAKDKKKYIEDSTSWISHNKIKNDQAFAWDLIEDLDEIPFYD